MGYENENRAAVVDYIASGAKPERLGKLGLEVEHHVLFYDGSQVAYASHGRPVGVRDVLEHLATWYPAREHNAKHDLLGLSGIDGTVTLEPAAQLEISVAPHELVRHVDAAYQRFRTRTDAYLAARGATLVTAGYHPVRKAQELELIPKQRYGHMDDYFASIGSHGDRMMRASTSTQVSIDYADEADAVRKMRVAAALAPILAAIADNTPTYDGRPNPIPIRRLQMWREVDNTRCGTPPHLFEAGYGFGTYVDWLFATPPIFVPLTSSNGTVTTRPAYTTPARNVYAAAPMSRADVEHLLSMFWPDVRLKRFVEIRPADGLPVHVIAGYVALIKGIFYAESSLAAIEKALGVAPGASSTRDAWPIGEGDVTAAIRRIQEEGFAARPYSGRTLREWEGLLFRLAREALPEDERAYIDQLVDFAADKPWWGVRHGSLVGSSTV